jgi:hypothetical protein
VSATALVAVDGAWLATLGLGAVVMRREAALLRERVRLSGAAVGDGLEVGAAAPAPFVRRDGVVLFLFGDCDPCHEVAAHVEHVARADRIAPVVVDGGTPGASATVLELLPPTVPAIVGGRADALRASFRVTSGPLAFVVRHGMIRAKTYVHEPRDLVELAERGSG